MLGGSGRKERQRRNSYFSVSAFGGYHSQCNAEREILSIDDDPVNQMVIEDNLSAEGFLVTKAMSGEEGLELLATRTHLPDLILLDISMPTMNGYEVYTYSKVA